MGCLSRNRRSDTCPDHDQSRTGMPADEKHRRNIVFRLERLIPIQSSVPRALGACGYRPDRAPQSSIIRPTDLIKGRGICIHGRGRIEIGRTGPTMPADRASCWAGIPCINARWRA